jgi:hypothetical protein
MVAAEPVAVQPVVVQEAPPQEAAPQPEPLVEDAGESEGGYHGPFGRSRTRLSLLIGSGSVSGDSYLILGLGIGYFLVAGLEVGADYEAWLFGDPVLQRLSPTVRYVFDFGTLKPYVGTFYRHTFVTDFEDFDHVGARAGLLLIPERGAFAGVGAVYERLLSCSDSDLFDCDTVYPEVTVGMAF